MRIKAISFLFAILTAAQCLAAIPATSVFEVQTGGNDLNGGAFDSAEGGIDRSDTETSPHVTIDGATITAVVHTSTEQLTITGYTVDDGDDSGNFVRISGGTANAGLYKIESADEPNNRWILDRSAGTAAQTATGRMGGCLATPGRAAADATVSGNKIWVKTGTYTITTTTPGTAGPVLFASAIDVIMEGYSSTRGDFAATPTLDAGAQTGISLFAGQGAGQQVVISMKADGQDGASTVGFSLSANQRHRAEMCFAFDCPTGFSGVRNNVEKCYAESCGTVGFTGCVANWSTANACATGFTLANTAEAATHCLAYSCTTDGFLASTSGTTFRNCTADSNTQYGFNLGAADVVCTNCLATNHSGGGDAGFFESGTTSAVLVNCAGYNNTSNKSGTFFRDIGFVSVTVDPYINQAGADFRPNRRSGGGLLLMKSGVGVYGQTDYKPIGALDFSPFILAR